MANTCSYSVSVVWRLVHTCDANASAKASNVHTSNANLSTFGRLNMADEVEVLVAFSVLILGLWLMNARAQIKKTKTCIAVLHIYVYWRGESKQSTAKKNSDTRWITQSYIYLTWSGLGTTNGFTAVRNQKLSDITTTCTGPRNLSRHEIQGDYHNLIKRLHLGDRK